MLRSLPLAVPYLALCTLAAAPAAATIAPNSLRLVETPADVHLEWTASSPPYGVFRGEDPDMVENAGSLIDTTAATSYDDPLAALTADLYYYQVGAAPVCPPGSPAELAGNALASYPFFESVRAFNHNATVDVAIDAGRYPAIAGQTCDVYVVEARSEDEWCMNPSLADARGGFDTRSFSAGSIQANTFPLVGPLQLPADAGTDLGRGYDVVLDCDRDGSLGTGDFIDGASGEAGLYIVHDITFLGPLATASFEVTGPLPEWPGPWPMEGDDLRVFYPAELDDPGFTATFPLVVISHGNGHSYAMYDFLGEHLASYGYIVLTHDNNTNPGIQTASLSTLRFTDRLLDEQGTLAGGVLDGHIDATRISWIGHSRGGEGVVRAYDRMVDEGWAPTHYLPTDIVLVVSIAPTDFLGHDGSVEPPRGPVPCAAVRLGRRRRVRLSQPSTSPTRSTSTSAPPASTASSAYVHGADAQRLQLLRLRRLSTGPAATRDRAPGSPA